MICFICKEDFPLLSTLVVHYIILHSLKPSSTYEYSENQCTQMFPNLNSFKKHCRIILLLRHYTYQLCEPSHLIPNARNAIYRGSSIDTVRGGEVIIFRNCPWFFFIILFLTEHNCLEIHFGGPRIYRRYMFRGVHTADIPSCRLL